MKILLANLNWHMYEGTEVSSSVPIDVPLELLYLAGGLRDKHRLDLYDAMLARDTWSEQEQRLRESHPDVIVISTVSNYLFWRVPPLQLSLAKRFVRLARRVTGAYVIVIGPHASTSPKWVLRELNPDALVRGEPELVFPMFIDGGLRTGDLSGVCTHDRISEPAVVSDLNTLPAPAYDMVLNDRYDCHYYSTKALVESRRVKVRGTMSEFSRGCPYQCPYCYRAGFRHEYRAKACEHALAELRAAKAAGFQYVYFIDEIFNLPTPGVTEFLRGLRSLGLRFGCQARPDVMTDSMLDLMVEAGLSYIEYGVETTDGETAQRQKKNANKRQLIDTVRKTQQLIGKDNVFISLLDFSAPDYSAFIGHIPRQPKVINTQVVPYPGTAFGDFMLKRYRVRPGREWDFAARYLWWAKYCHYMSLEGKGSNSVVQLLLSAMNKHLLLRLPVSVAGSLYHRLVPTESPGPISPRA